MDGVLLNSQMPLLVSCSHVYVHTCLYLKYLHIALKCIDSAATVESQTPVSPVKLNLLISSQTNIEGWGHLEGTLWWLPHGTRREPLSPLLDILTPCRTEIQKEYKT